MAGKDYRPPGQAGGEEAIFIAPEVGAQRSIHIILAVKDNGTPNLYAYRRAVVRVSPK